MHEMLQATSVDHLVDHYFQHVVVFVLVLTRLSGLMMTAPVYGSRNTPIRVKAFTAMAISLMIAPVFWESTLETPDNLIELVLLMVRELTVGLALGVGTLILLSGLQLSGHVASQMSGMALADVFDPGFDTSVPVFSQFLDVVTIAVFVCLGGHRTVMNALLDTFRWMPPGSPTLGENVLDLGVELVQQSFLLGIRAAGPMMVSILLSILILGLVSRTLPQLNVLAVGFSLNSLIMLGTMAMSLGTITMLFHEELTPAIHTILEMFVQHA